MTSNDRCRLCKRAIPGRRKFCRRCSRRALRETKRLWSAQWRAKNGRRPNGRELHERGVQEQRRTAVLGQSTGTGRLNAGDLGTGNLHGKRLINFEEERRAIEREMKRIGLPVSTPRGR